ncbi:MAG: hypothetical protein ACRC6X_06110 [Culicoidibacterales bacterium]
MQAETKNINILFLIRSGLLTIVTILLYYPKFGGALTVLNGVFIYFSYFLATIMLLVYAIMHFVALFRMKYVIDEKIKLQQTKEEFVLFSYAAVMIMTALLQGRYIMLPILGVSYILLELLPVYRFMLYAGRTEMKCKRTIWTWVKEVLFFVTCLLFFVGNQPFQQLQLPVAELLLLILIFINIYTYWQSLSLKS